MRASFQALARARLVDNPAWKAMGLPSKLPSRNWMIFWAVVGSVTGITLLDRNSRLSNRQKWKDQVAPVGLQTMEPMQLPRRVTVYLAPPPGDYLDHAQSHFRQYIKPILTASATDYVVCSETRQGEIRAQVADQIRARRRKELGLPIDDGKDELDRRIESHLNEDSAPGGVICVGRGAYKEYINGLHEGWLGPLEAPVKTGAIALDQPETASTVEFPDRLEDLKDVMGEKPESEKTVSKDADEAKSEAQDTDKKDKKDKKPVPKPYILPQEYLEAPLSAETARAVANGTISEPIAVLTHPHLLGIIYTPIRMYRYWSRRFLADRLGRETAAVVYERVRPFDMNHDSQLCVEEENDWPAKWKSTGRDEDSEWMRDFVVDDRLMSSVQVYDFDAKTE